MRDKLNHRPGSTTRLRTHGGESVNSILNEYGVLGSLLIDPSLFPEAAELPDELADAAPLLAPAPYDGLYRHYVEAQIHYCNGEMARYNSAAANWNNGLLTYRDYVCRTTAPTQNVRALKLC